jgi:diketogulonate reductase-like aldo/keto reductase
MQRELLNRRAFNAICAAITSFVTYSGQSVLGAAIGLAQTGPGRSVKFRDGTVVSALGQGSARLAHGRRPQAEEEEALRTGISLGMTLINTAESYGSEELIGRVIAGRRDRVFLVSKVSANHVGGNGIARACEASLTRLRTDWLDLYLLHWPNGNTDYAGLVTAFENLRSSGKIRGWGFQFQCQSA